MAEDANEAAKKRAAEAKEVSRREYEERSKGKPTPTQEENDRAAMGEHVVEKEPDGSPEEGAGPQHTRHSEANKPAGGYETRAGKPAAQPPQRPAAPRSE